MFLLLRVSRLALLVLGALRLGLSRPAGWIVLAVLLLPGPLVYIVSRAKNHYLYEWYLLFTLSGLVGFAALGVDWLAAPRSPRSPLRRTLHSGTRRGHLLCCHTAAASLACDTFAAANEGGRAADSAESLIPTILVRNPS